MTRPILLLGAALALLLARPAAAADDVAEARARFGQGTKLYQAGKYRDAIVEFEAAYRIKPAGAIHYNVAQCREKLEQWPEALQSYHDYLREVPDARDRAAVRATIGRIERRLAAAGVQALLVYTDPPGAAVRIDGKSRGRTPYHVTLAPGSYRVGLALDGYTPEEVEAEMSMTGTRLVDVVLRPRIPVPAAGVAAVAYGAAASRQAETLRDGTVHSDAAALASGAQSKATTANVLYGISGVAAAAGVTLFFVEGTF